MNVQVTLTVSEAKWIIAKGIVNLPCVQKALVSGKVFLKGGTTVSAVCEEMTGKPLRISGRIVPSGTKTGQGTKEGFHSALIRKGKFIGVDDTLPETIEGLGREDVAVIGANAYDASGIAALMYGSPLGGDPGRIISGLMADVKHLIMPVGLEKFIPGSILEIIQKTSRKTVDQAMGMAVGLTAIIGRIITEIDAIKLLANVDCTIVGRGGIDGAEGATTFLIEGKQKEVQKAFDLILSVKGKAVSGCLSSREACEPPHEKCKIHRACMYKKAPRKVRKTVRRG